MHRLVVRVRTWAPERHAVDDLALMNESWPKPWRIPRSLLPDLGGRARGTPSTREHSSVPFASGITSAKGVNRPSRSALDAFSLSGHDRVDRTVSYSYDPGIQRWGRRRKTHPLSAQSSHSLPRHRGRTRLDSSTVAGSRGITIVSLTRPGRTGRWRTNPAVLSSALSPWNSPRREPDHWR